MAKIFVNYQPSKYVANYITDEGTGNNGPCLLDYLWLGNEFETFGTLDGKELDRLEKLIKRIKKRRAKRN